MALFSGMRPWLRQFILQHLEAAIEAPTNPAASSDHPLDVPTRPPLPALTGQYLQAQTAPSLSSRMLMVHDGAVSIQAILTRAAVAALAAEAEEHGVEPRALAGHILAPSAATLLPRRDSVQLIVRGVSVFPDCRMLCPAVLPPNVATDRAVITALRAAHGRSLVALASAAAVSPAVTDALPPESVRRRFATMFDPSSERMQAPPTLVEQCLREDQGEEQQQQRQQQRQQQQTVTSRQRQPNLQQSEEPRPGNGTAQDDETQTQPPPAYVDGATGNDSSSGQVQLETAPPQPNVTRCKTPPLDEAFLTPPPPSCDSNATCSASRAEEEGEVDDDAWLVQVTPNDDDNTGGNDARDTGSEGGYSGDGGGDVLPLTQLASQEVSDVDAKDSQHDRAGRVLPQVEGAGRGGEFLVSDGSSGGRGKGERDLGNRRAEKAARIRTMQIACNGSGNSPASQSPPPRRPRLPSPLCSSSSASPAPPRQHTKNEENYPQRSSPSSPATLLERPGAERKSANKHARRVPSALFRNIGIAPSSDSGFPPGTPSPSSSPPPPQLQSTKRKREMPRRAAASADTGAEPVVGEEKGSSVKTRARGHDAEGASTVNPEYEATTSQKLSSQSQEEPQARGENPRAAKRRRVAEPQEEQGDSRTRTIEADPSQEIVEPPTPMPMTPMPMTPGPFTPGPEGDEGETEASPKAAAQSQGEEDDPVKESQDNSDKEADAAEANNKDTSTEKANGEKSSHGNKGTSSEKANGEESSHGNKGTSSEKANGEEPSPGNNKDNLAGEKDKDLSPEGNKKDGVAVSNEENKVSQGAKNDVVGKDAEKGTVDDPDADKESEQPAKESDEAGAEKAKNLANDESEEQGPEEGDTGGETEGCRAKENKNMPLSGSLQEEGGEGEDKQKNSEEEPKEKVAEERNENGTERSDVIVLDAESEEERRKARVVETDNEEPEFEVAEEDEETLRRAKDALLKEIEILKTFRMARDRDPTGFALDVDAFLPSDPSVEPPALRRSGHDTVRFAEQATSSPPRPEAIATVVAESAPM